MARTSLNNSDMGDSAPVYYMVNEDRHAKMHELALAIMGIANMIEHDDVSVSNSQTSAILGVISDQLTDLAAALPRGDRTVH